MHRGGRPQGSPPMTQGRMMALMDPVAVLAESTLFRAVPPAELEALAPAATSRTFKKGNYIFRQGDLGNALYVVRRGPGKIFRVGRGGGEGGVFVPIGRASLRRS